jgi:hypothetical protein
MKLCIDCKYYLKGVQNYSWIRESQCLHEDNKSPVDGKPDESLNRLRMSLARCGREGKWFEPKQSNERKDGECCEK